jgi:arginyl-tRNA synthetase
LLLSVLKNCKKEIMEAEDFGDILSPIRCKNEEEEHKSKSGFMNKLKSFLWLEESFWEVCIKDASNFHFDNKKVLIELTTFDSHEKKFGIV